MKINLGIPCHQIPALSPDYTRISASILLPSLFLPVKQALIAAEGAARNLPISRLFVVGPNGF